MNRNPSRRFMFCLLVLAVAVSGGCRKKSSHSRTSQDDDIFTTDDFPGAPVQAGNVAADLRAMSNAGETAFGAQCTFDGTRGAAIVTYVGIEAGPGGPFYHVYAHYYDGETWTPPIALDAMDTDLTLPASPRGVAFLRADGDRDGDALVFWTALDVAGSSPGDGQNFGLFATYFDASASADPARRYGFQTLATRLDALDGNFENVDSFTFVTDGLRGEHAFPGGGSVAVGGTAQGDPTTGIVACWTQAEDNDPQNIAMEDRGLWFCAWTLPGPADPDLPLSPSVATRIPTLDFGASDAGTSSEETLVGTRYVVYNNLLFFLVAANVDPLSGGPGNHLPPVNLTSTYGAMFGVGDDVVIECVAFDLAAGTAGPARCLATTDPDATDGLSTMMAFLYETDFAAYAAKTPSCFGSDEGLAECVIVTVELDGDPDTTDFGTGVQDGVLKLTGLDEATGAVHGTAIVSVDDPAIFDSVDPGHVAVQISRNGDYLWLAWLQPEAAGATDDLALRVAQFVTTRAGDAIPSESSATSAPIAPNADVDGYGVGWLRFQDGLGYVCGAQSDPDVMNLFVEHGSAAYDRVICFRLTADLAVPPVPGVAVFPVTSFEEGEMAAKFLNRENHNFAAADAGSGGDAIAFYRADVDGTAGTDYRLFARRVGPAPATVEIGSAVDGRQVPDQDFSVVVTPAGGEIGTFDFASGEDSPDRPHAARDVHLLFLEDRFTATPGVGPALRTRVFSGEADPVAPLGDAFAPPVGQPPFDLDLPGIAPGPLQSPVLIGAGRDGGSVGVWFRETGHFFYQEFDPGDRAWRTSEGVGDPALIDDDTPVEAEPQSLFVLHPEGCRSFHGAALFWGKDLDGSGTSYRLQVRIRD